MTDNKTMKSFETNGYVKLHTRNPFRQMYAYLDTSDCLADQLFIKEKVRVKFKYDFVHTSGRFLCVFVTCWKKRCGVCRMCLVPIKTKSVIVWTCDRLSGYVPKNFGTGTDSDKLWISMWIVWISVNHL